MNQSHGYSVDQLVAENRNPYDGEVNGPRVKTYRSRSGQARVKPSIELVEQLDADNLGFCLACGADEQVAEPDAVRYTCECCGERKVYGAAELALLGLVF